MSTLFPSLRLSALSLSALLLRLRLRDNVVRFRRRVSPTSLTPPLRFARPAPLRHFSRAPFPLSRVTGFTLSTLLPCCSRPYSFPRASNPFDQLHFRRSAIPRFPPPLFSPCRGHLPSPHFYRCSPTALPAGFIREAKCARDSYSLRKRASEREREKKRGKGTLFLEGRNENYAGPTSASAHLLARKGCNGRRRWTKKPGGKKR